MNIWFVAAGALSFGITLLHLFGGGPTVAAPLLAAKGLNDVVRYLNYYCWHLVSISLALMALAFGWAAGFCIWGVALVILKQQQFREMPQGWLFLPVALLGFCGFAL